MMKVWSACWYINRKYNMISYYKWPKSNQLGDEIWPKYDQLGETGMSGNIFHEGADPQLKAHFSKQIVVPQCVRIWSIDGIKN